MRRHARGPGQSAATTPVDGTFSLRANSSNASRVGQVSTYVEGAYERSAVEPASGWDGYAG
jgi:hypothetical protein